MAMAVKITKRKKIPRDAQPTITITGISTDEFDYMPNLKLASSLPDDQKKIITTLKNGTYVPFMAAVQYKASKDKENIFFTPSDVTFESTNKDYFSFSAAVYRKKKLQSDTVLDMVLKQFEKTDAPIMPRYYHNPLQYFDHILLADAYTNSFAGTVADTLVDFIMPKALKPVLQLRNPDTVGDADSQQKTIQENQQIIERLTEIDNWYSDDSGKEIDPYMNLPIMVKFKSAILNHIVFGRACIAFENWEHIEPVKVGGKEYKEIPNVLKVLQPIDMGMAILDPYTGNLGGVYIHSQMPFLSADKMIYLVNKPMNPMIGSMYYGASVLQRAIDPVRLLRRIFAQNYPQFIRTGHSGMGYFIFNSTQYDETTRKSIRSQIVSSYKAGEIGIIDYANVTDFEFKEVKVTPEIASLQQLQEQLMKVVCVVMGVPQSLVFDDGAATRDTLIGRLVSFLNNTVSRYRESLAAQIAAQWYARNFRLLYKDEPEVLKKFKIAVQFEEMDLETKREKIDRLLSEMQLNPMTDEYLGEQLGDKQYLDHIDVEKREQQYQQNMQNPFGRMGVRPQGTYTVKDSQGTIAKVERKTT